MLCALLFSVIAWGQEPTILSGGSGISSDPYQIGADDWEEFATMINTTGGDYLTAHYKLIENVTTGSATINSGTTTVTSNGTMIGTSGNKFSGTFNGDGYTLTFYYSGTGEAGVPVAPFQYTEGAVFTNLTVAGKIVTEIYGAAGLIGHNTTNTTQVTEVKVGMIIDGNEETTGHMGGFAVDGSKVSFENCVFNGSFGAYGDYTDNGGFCGNGDSNTQLTNCLFNPISCTFWGENFVYGTEFNSTNLTNCYYTKGAEENSTQGVLAYTLIPDNKIGHYEITVINTRVYTDAKIELFGVENEYLYDMEETISLDIPYSVKYNNGANAISAGVCLAVILNDSDEPVTTITTTGTYRLIITGIHNNETNDGYHGTITKTFEVKKVSFGNWDDLKTLLANNSSITLTCNYRDGHGGSGTLIIDRDIEIDLNGFTIDRNLSEATEEGQVIRINSGKTVSITGPGVITGAWNKAKTTTEHGEYNDGGGIYNKGTLTLNTVTIANNKCVKKETGTSSTARGGGIYSGQGSSLTMTNVIVKNNHAQGGGGGVFVEGTTVNITGSTIRSNESYDKGGGIRLKKCGTTNISNTEISYNEADNSGYNSVANGGGIHMEDGSGNNSGILNLNTCVITNNRSTKFGGGMYILSGMVNATNCNIDYNECYDPTNMYNGRGGGVYIHSGSFKMNGGTVIGNSSKMANGGGVFVNTIGSNNTAYFGIQGNVQIKDNWRFDENDLKDPTPTNVYIAGKDNTIHIEGDLDENAEIWVSKNGGSGDITTGLGEHQGDASQFKSDEGYTVNPAATEAGLSNPDAWSDETRPTGVTPVTVTTYKITEPVIISSVLTDVESVSFEDDGCLILKDGGYLATNVIIDNSDDKKNNRVVVYGGEIVPTNDPPVAIPAIVKKDIHWASDSGDYWYAISSAISEPNIITKTNLITIDGYITIEGVDYPDDQYDLYRFNESVELQWENYRSTSIVHTGFDVNNTNSSLENGRGYLYRNENDYTVTYRGTINTGNIAYPLSYTSTVGGQDNPLVGFNLIGNPYTQKITMLNTTLVDNDGNQIKDGETPVNLTGFYKLSTEGNWGVKITSDAEKIDVGEGVLVQVPEAAKKVKFSQTERAAKRANGDNIMFAIANSIYSDQTYALFENGLSLNKINQQNENIPMLYINHNDEDFAIATMNKDTKSFNLNFEAKATGLFTLSCKTNGDFSYLHLIDKVAGCDVDLLNGSDYSFIGMPGDSKDRFVVRLSETVTDSHGNVIFAYQNGNDIIVSGEGELQIFDVMGRMIATQRINGVETVNVSTTGVYIFRLNEKSQKIVVR